MIPSASMDFLKQSKGPLKESLDVSWTVPGDKIGWVCNRTLMVSKGNSTNLPANPAILRKKIKWFKKWYNGKWRRKLYIISS